ncbi:MAG: hypothetical protein SGPRY_006838, partial [Prymnesium sp.]
YDPEAIREVWSNHRRCAIARLTHIGSRVVPFALRISADVIAERCTLGVERALRSADETGEERKAAREKATAERHARRAVQLRHILIDLGPTFIKFGQMLSIRPDLVPPVAIYELQVASCKATS